MSDMESDNSWVELKQESILRAGYKGIYETKYYLEVDIGEPSHKLKAKLHFNCDVSVLPKRDNFIRGCYKPRLSLKSSLVSFNDYYCNHSGDMYIDQITINSSKGHISFQFPFAMTSKFYENFGFGYDAILGLSCRHNDDSSFLQSLVSAGLSESKQYSPIFDGENKSGAILFGPIDSSLYEGELNVHKFQKYPILNALKLDFVNLYSARLYRAGYVQFDISSSDLKGPREDIDRIYRALDAQVKDGLAILPDDTWFENLPTLIFKIGQVEYEYPPELYVKRAGSTLYLGMRYANPINVISSIDTQGVVDKWVFGADFFTKYYTWFDPTQSEVKIGRRILRACGEVCTPKEENINVIDTPCESPSSSD